MKHTQGYLLVQSFLLPFLSYPFCTGFSLNKWCALESQPQGLGLCTITICTSYIFWVTSYPQT